MSANVEAFTSWSTTLTNNQPTSTDTADLVSDLTKIQAEVKKFTRAVATPIASATTVDLSAADGEYVSVTGTTTITGLGTVAAGIRFYLVFAASLTVTHNGTSLILPDAMNIITNAGDVLLVESLGSGNWKCIAYHPIDTPIISVKRFGATGDGATNDTAAFTAAAAAVSTVLVPSGTYNLATSPTGAITWIVTEGATFTGAGVLPGTMMRVGATNFELRRVDNSTFPLNYATSEVAGVVQWDDSGTLGSNATADGFVFRFQSTGDGSVGLDSSLSGGASLSVWRGLYSGMIKSGDGSGHSFSGNGQLGAVGATGYNELGGIIYTGTNIGSLKGTVHGSELLVRDGTGTVQTSGTAQAGAATTITLAAGASAVNDAYKNYAIHITGGTGSGQYRNITGYVGSTKVATVAAWGTNPDVTSTYEVIAVWDTFLVSHIARNSRKFGGARKSISFAASSEGDIVSSSILEALTGGPGWTNGIDFSEQAFASGRWAVIQRGQNIGIDDGTGTVSNMFGASSLGVALIRGTNTNETTQVTAQDGTVLMQFDGQLKAGNPVQMTIGGTLKQVTAGANDSGGTGYKLLRVTN